MFRPHPAPEMLAAIRRMGLLAVALGAISASARADKIGGWADAPDDVKAWLQNQKQPGSGISCCGLGDAVNVEMIGETPAGYRLRVINGRGHLENGTEIFSAADRVVRTNIDPDGNAVAWVSGAGQVYCVSFPPKA